jgi:hypothetical protein
MSREAEREKAVAQPAGATRGARRTMAVELARASLFATGRSSRSSGPSELDRPETIEETGELIEATGEASMSSADFQCRCRRWDSTWDTVPDRTHRLRSAW